MDVNYFGYGEKRSPKMMEAIIGRKPKGSSVWMPDHELVVVSWRDIPESVRCILSQSWDPSFKNYAIRPREGGYVSGVVWGLTKDEMGLLARWGLHRYDWYTPVTYEALFNNGKKMYIETEIIDDHGIGFATNGLKYPLFLNNERRMIEVARRVREKYLQNRKLSIVTPDGDN